MERVEQKYATTPHRWGAVTLTYDAHTKHLMVTFDGWTASGVYELVQSGKKIRLGSDSYHVANTIIDLS